MLAVAMGDSGHGRLFSLVATVLCRRHSHLIWLWSLGPSLSSLQFPYLQCCVNSAVRRQEQDPEFKASWSCTVRSCLKNKNKKSVSFNVDFDFPNAASALRSSRMKAAVISDRSPMFFVQLNRSQGREESVIWRYFSDWYLQA